ncbi:hypothetical protein J3R74_001872 [Puniceicoccus vermicola]
MIEALLIGRNEKNIGRFHVWGWIE